MTIGTFNDFITWTLGNHSKSKLMLFRGQPVEGNLLPSIARLNPKYDSTQLERTMLDQFRLMGASLLLNVEKSQFELLIVAQHFGLKTRLLDWTSNPLVALYFACNDETDKDSFVYSLSAETMTHDVFEKDPFSLPRTRIFQPPMNNPRIIAQQGWFTIHRYSDKSEGFVPLERNKDTKEYLDVVRVDGSAKKDLLKALAGHGISSHTLFPDLSGLTQHLNKVHALT